MADFFERFDTSSFNIRSKATGNSLRLSVYQGNVSLQIWGNDNSNRPLYRKGLNPDLLQIIRMNIKKLANTKAPLKLPIVCQKYVAEDKKFIPDCTIIMEMTDTKVITITVEWVVNERPSRDVFPLLIASGISIDSEPMTDATKSYIKLQSLNSFITELVPMSIVLTKRKYQASNSNTNPAPF